VIIINVMSAAGQFVQSRLNREMMNKGRKKTPRFIAHIFFGGACSDHSIGTFEPITIGWDLTNNSKHEEKFLSRFLHGTKRRVTTVPIQLRV
jgi:hypothetical protein